MRFTYIDSASINSISHFFSCGSIEEIDTWTIDIAIEITTAMMLTNNLSVIPSPEPVTASYGELGDLKRKLSSHVTDYRLVKENSENSLQKTLDWVNGNSNNLKEVFNEIYLKKECKEWLEKEKTRIWSHHADTHKGLFNLTFEESISNMLNIDTHSLRSLHSLSCKSKEIENYVYKSRLYNEFKIIEKAYVLSAIIRGVHKDSIAEASSNSIIQHPVRRDVRFFPNNVSTENISVELSNTAVLLSKIILWMSFKESQSDRLGAYINYLYKARNMVLSEQVDISSKRTLNAAMDTAINAAKRIGVHTRNRQFYDALDLFFGFGSGVLTSFVLTPFAGVSVAIGTVAVTKKWNISEKIGRKFDTEKKYRQIFKDSSGRISTIR